MIKKIVLLFSFLICDLILINHCLVIPFLKIWKYVFIVLLIFSLIFYLITLFFIKNLNKISFYINLISIFIVSIFIIFYYTGLLTKFSSFEDARLYFQSYGKFALLIFFIIQILQVVILPIPAQITTIAGVLIFGPFKTFLVSSFAVIIGSIICFFIGRIFGTKILYKLAKKETVDKYRKLLTDKGKILLPVMFLFPAFPDDLLCFISGTTNFSFLYFFITTITTRIVGVICICYFGSGEVIPFHGIGIIIWILIFIAMIIILYYLFKYQEKLENFIINKFTKNKEKEKSERT